MDNLKLPEDLVSDIDDLIDNFKYDILTSLNNNLKEKKDNMILDVENFIFEINKEKNLLSVELKEFIDYYIKYKQ